MGLSLKMSLGQIEQVTEWNLGQRVVSPSESKHELRGM